MSLYEEDDEIEYEEQYDYQEDREYIFYSLDEICDKLHSLSEKVQEMNREIFDLKLKIRRKSSMLKSQNLSEQKELKGE